MADGDTQRCTNEHCSSVWKPGMHCYKIEAGKTWGNRDWSAIDGSVLCGACYTRFIKTGSLEKKEMFARRCTYEHCGSPTESSNFFQIWEGKTFGGQDWSSLVGRVLCNACYDCFKRKGTLERDIRNVSAAFFKTDKNKQLPVSARRCTYSGCVRPHHSRFFYQIVEGTTAGGRDWSSLVGSKLCHTCYECFKREGTLEKRDRIQGISGRPLPESERRCTYDHCDRPNDSCQFYQIEEGKTAGGQDWSSVAGSVLCKTCYQRFSKRGTLERDQIHIRPLPQSARRCTYEHCDRPTDSSQFHQIWEGKTSGGQDWSSLVGSVLCRACYESFKRKGTLERDPKRSQAQPRFHARRPLPPRAKQCTYEHCDWPTESSKFHQIQEGKAAGGQDWSTLVGSVLCNACHDCFKRRGTLERASARIKRHRKGPGSVLNGSLVDDAEISETELCQRPDLESGNEEYISPGPGPSEEISGMLDTVKRQKANSHHGLEHGMRRCEDMPRAPEPSTPLALRWSWMIDGKCPVTGARAIDEFLADDDEDGFEKYLMCSWYDKGQQQGCHQGK